MRCVLRSAYHVNYVPTQQQSQRLPTITDPTNNPKGMSMVCGRPEQMGESSEGLS